MARRHKPCFGSVRQFLDLSAEHQLRPHIVGWLDCQAPSAATGRGVFFSGGVTNGGETRPPRRLPALPMAAPEWLGTRATSRLFNAAYRLAHRRATVDDVHYESFFFPLDAIPRWNLLYGASGFLQWQCVVPDADAIESLDAILRLVSRSGEGACLGVIKKFGDRQWPGLLSFPRSGITVAMDFPIRGPRIFVLLDALDAIVAEAGGALYAAKDARMSADMFRRSNPRLDTFLPFRDPGIRSRMWDRVVGVGAP